MKRLTLMIVLFFSTFQSATAKQGDYFLRPVFGLSQLSNTSGASEGLGQVDGDIMVNIDNGINAGLGFGYFYNDNFAVELFWEYRSNESQTTLPDATFYEEGNYASNLIIVNGHYYFDTTTNWQFYAGLGLGWVQEIDIDLEQGGTELSYTGSGDIAFQGFAGVDYTISKTLSVNVEARYTQVGSPKLEGENTIGTINTLDYSPSTLQLGLTWRF